MRDIHQNKTENRGTNVNKQSLQNICKEWEMQIKHRCMTRLNNLRPLMNHTPKKCVLVFRCAKDCTPVVVFFFNMMEPDAKKPTKSKATIVFYML